MQLWAIAQERCSFSPYRFFIDEGLQLTPSLISSTFTVSVPFPSTVLLDPPARFSSILTLNTAQAFGSLVASFLYLMVRRPSSAPSVKATLGLDRKENTQPLLFGYFKIALLNTCAAPFGFASLRHISYPTMVLGKSCKLVPVLFMNVSRLPVLTLLFLLALDEGSLQATLFVQVLLYRRKFPPHKYLVVSLVTLGISLFMLLGSEGPSSKHSSSKKEPSTGGESLLGLGLLVVNLLIDGATNSSQDEIFKKFKGVTGACPLSVHSKVTMLTLAIFWK